MSSRPTWITYQDPLSKKRKEGREAGRKALSGRKIQQTEKENGRKCHDGW
jgi:hypothetical protein